MTIGLLPATVDTDNAALTSRGGFIGYTATNFEMGRLAASLVDKILKGASPRDLPVQQPTAYEFVVNQTVANALGITIAPDVAQEVTHWDQ